MAELLGLVVDDRMQDAGCRRQDVEGRMLD